MHTLTDFIIVNKSDERVGITYAKRMRTRNIRIYSSTYTSTHMCGVCVCVCSRSDSLCVCVSLTRSPVHSFGLKFSSQSSNIDLTIPSHFKTSSVFYVRSMRTVLKLFKFQFLLTKRRKKNTNQIVCISIYLWTHLFSLLFSLIASFGKF